MSQSILLLASPFSVLTFLIYSDPGSGMLIWQLATAAVIGLLFYAKTIVRKFRLLMGANETESTESTSDKN